MAEEYRLVRTCTACPEQYDVFLGEEQVGYLRLRHGYFRAEVMPEEIKVYWATSRGDGSFADEQERAAQLAAALCQISEWRASRNLPGPTPQVPYRIEDCCG